LAKQNAEDDSLVDVYELIINGQEISPGYSELNDPSTQRKRLLEQAGEETQKIDEEFLLALEHGMPPAGGFGMGIDRVTHVIDRCRIDPGCDSFSPAKTEKARFIASIRCRRRRRQSRPRFGFSRPRPIFGKKWLQAHHERSAELWVGFHKKASGRRSITWPEVGR
jgi:hypothetical protein